MLLLVLVLVLVGMVLTGVLLVLAEAAAASRAVQSAATGKIVGGVPERQLIASFLLDDAEDETGEGRTEEGRTVVLVLAVVVVLLELDGAAAQGRAERAAATGKIVGGVPERQLIVSFLRGVAKEGTAEEGGSLILLVVVTVAAIGGNGVGTGGSIKFGVEGTVRRVARDVTVVQAVGRTAVGRFDETGTAKLTVAVGGLGVIHRFRSDGGEEKEAGVTVGSGLKTGEGRGDVAASRERNVTACNGEEKVREPLSDGLGLVRERRRD
jgi:hypothetical protein